MHHGITERLSHTPRTLRLRLRGWSQRRLAFKAHVSVNTVAAIESGGHVNTRKVAAVAKALGVQRWELIRAMDEIDAPILVGAA